MFKHADLHTPCIVHVTCFRAPFTRSFQPHALPLLGHRPRLGWQRPPAPGWCTNPPAMHAELTPSHAQGTTWAEPQQGWPLPQDKVLTGWSNCADDHTNTGKHLRQHLQACQQSCYSTGGSCSSLHTQHGPWHRRQLQGTCWANQKHSSPHMQSPPLKHLSHTPPLHRIYTAACVQHVCSICTISAVGGHAICQWGECKGASGAMTSQTSIRQGILVQGHAEHTSMRSGEIQDGPASSTHQPGHR